MVLLYILNITFYKYKKNIKMYSLELEVNHVNKRSCDLDSFITFWSHPLNMNRLLI